MGLKEIPETVVVVEPPLPPPPRSFPGAPSKALGYNFAWPDINIINICHKFAVPEFWGCFLIIIPSLYLTVYHFYFNHSLTSITVHSTTY